MGKTILLLFVAFFIACSSSESNIAGNTKAAAAQNGQNEAMAVDGAAVFKLYCVLCHGADGKLGNNGAKDLGLSQLDKAQRIEIVKNGKKLMTPFKEVLSEEEINAVVDYTFTFKSE